MNTIAELIAAIKNGDMVILLDDEGRENEGDLVMAAEVITPEQMNFIVRHTSGIVCLPMPAEQCQRLGLPLMVERNKDRFNTSFTWSIEAAEGVTTGVSVADRTRTAHAAARLEACAEDVVSPGHMFPLRACTGGVLERAGHTEATTELVRLAGFASGVGVLCEVVNEDGSMARRPQLEAFARQHQLKIGTIAQLIEYRRAQDEQTTATEKGEVA